MGDPKIDDYVVLKGGTNTVGKIVALEYIHGVLTTATVNWGTADNRLYQDDIPIEELEEFTEPILQPDEVLKRQAEAAGGKLVD